MALSGTDPRIAQYAKLVRGQVTRFLPTFHGRADRDDLLSIGMIALWEATLSFDEARGVKFITYATNVVRWALTAERSRLRRVRRGGRAVVMSMHAEDDDGLGVDPACPLPPPDALVENAEFRDVIEGALSTLSPRMREILRRRFVCDQTHADIGAALGSSRQAIQQLEAAAIKRLRPHFTRTQAQNRSEG